jgi:hypothetical protein
MPRTSAADKNSSVIDKYYIKTLKDKTKVSCKEDLENIFKSGYSLAKVIKNLGNCRLQVVEQNGNIADVRISTSVIQMIKRESAVNEIVLIDGGFIKAKIPAPIVLDILTIFEKCGYELPKIFFAVSAATEEDDMFDHGADAVAEEEPVAELDVDNI